MWPLRCADPATLLPILKVVCPEGTALRALVATAAPSVDVAWSRALYAAACWNPSPAPSAPDVIVYCIAPPMIARSDAPETPFTNKMIRLAAVPSSVATTEGAAVADEPESPTSTTNVPSVWLYQLEKFVPVMLARSAVRASAAPALMMTLVAKVPVSSWAYSTEPETVSVSVPAVGVNVSVERVGYTPEPTSGPAVDVPDSVTVPVP